MISPDIVFLFVAGIAFLGFVLDAFFDKIRLTSVLPLMIIGVLLVQFSLVPRNTLSFIQVLIPYVSSLTIAFILFAVGLEIRFSQLFNVLGRATLFTLVVQASTGVALSFVALFFFHWSFLICLIFGFALSGPSSVAVPALVRVARMSETLKTSLVFEAVVSDVLQLLVPLIVLSLILQGKFSGLAISESLFWKLIGSSAVGFVSAVVWLWILEHIRGFSSGYVWTLTITMVLATYGVSDWIGMNAAIAIFIFGLVLGNAYLLDSLSWQNLDPTDSGATHLLRSLGKVLDLSTADLDISYIQKVQKEVSFFASSFFFVYLGLLFQVSGLSLWLIAAIIAVCLIILGLRRAFLPILNPYLDPKPQNHRSETFLVSFNVPRALATAVVATLPLSMGIKIPGFLDAMFLGILFTNIVSTMGVVAFYRSRPEGSTPAEPLPE